MQPKSDEKPNKKKKKKKKDKDSEVKSEWDKEETEDVKLKKKMFPALAMANDPTVRVCKLGLEEILVK